MEEIDLLPYRRFSFIDKVIVFINSYKSYSNLNINILKNVIKIRMI